MRCLLLSVVAYLFATSFNAFPYSDSSYQLSSIDIVEFEKADSSDLNLGNENLDSAFDSVGAADLSTDHPGCAENFGKRQISNGFSLGIFHKFPISSFKNTK